jgi:hypothetical protein
MNDVIKLTIHGDKNTHVTITKDNHFIVVRAGGKITLDLSDEGYAYPVRKLMESLSKMEVPDENTVEDLSSGTIVGPLSDTARY